MWTLTEMRVALARHDIGTVFRIMQRHGLPQREIAALTGITQSEVSEIICGRRKIHGYAVLNRLVEGLRLPRGWVGLAFDDETAKFRSLGSLHKVVNESRSATTCGATRYSKESRDGRRRLRRLPRADDGKGHISDSW
jgi:transcriptional regulator with XRE-family HTH domain